MEQFIELIKTVEGDAVTLVIWWFAVQIFNNVLLLVGIIGGLHTVFKGASKLIQQDSFLNSLAEELDMSSWNMSHTDSMQRLHGKIIKLKEKK